MSTTNYVDDIAARLQEMLGVEADLLRLYTLLALVKGTDVTEEDVHDAWSIWRAASRPDHPSLVPFDQLTVEVQALDTKYAEAIRAAAVAK